jgi:hypothetical protein
MLSALWRKAQAEDPQHGLARDSPPAVVGFLGAGNPAVGACQPDRKLLGTQIAGSSQPLPHTNNGSLKVMH